MRYWITFFMYLALDFTTTAQPIGGYTEVKIDDGKDEQATYTVTIVYDNSVSPVDDSLIYNVSALGNNSNGKIFYTSKIKSHYTNHTTQTYTLLTKGLGNGKSNDCTFLFIYNHNQTQLDTLVLQSWFDVKSEGYFSSINFLPPVFYHHPNQELSIGFLKQQELYNWPDIPWYSYYWSTNNTIIPTMNILKETGNIIANKQSITNSISFNVINTTMSLHNYKYTNNIEAFIIVDSTLTGSFNYSKQYQNNAGFINITCEKNKAFQFSFDYLDKEVDSVAIEFNYSRAHLNSSINYTAIKKTDSTTINVTGLFSEEEFKHLPQPINFVIYPYKNNKSKPRNFSFNVVKDFSTGLPVISKKHQLDIYPNPSNGLVMLSNFADIYSISVINNLGQELLTEINSSNFIDISTLQNGIYFIIIANKNGEKVAKRLVKY